MTLFQFFHEVAKIGSKQAGNDRRVLSNQFKAAHTTTSLKQGGGNESKTFEDCIIHVEGGNRLGFYNWAEA